MKFTISTPPKLTLEQRIAALEKEVFEPYIKYSSPLCLRHREIVERLYKFAEMLGYSWQSKPPTTIEGWVKKHWWNT